jgi:hypothetical protein
MAYEYGDPFESKQAAREAGRAQDDGMTKLFVGIEIVGTVMVRSVLEEEGFDVPERISRLRRKVLTREYRPVWYVHDGPTLQETVAWQRQQEARR